MTDQIQTLKKSDGTVLIWKWVQTPKGPRAEIMGIDAVLQASPIRKPTLRLVGAQ